MSIKNFKIKPQVWPKEYTFEEYVNLLLKINMSKEYPDINNISK